MGCENNPSTGVRGMVFTASELTEALFFYRDRVEAHFEKQGVSQCLTAKRVASIFGIESLLQVTSKYRAGTAEAITLRRRAMWALDAQIRRQYPALEDTDITDEMTLRRLMISETHIAKALVIRALIKISDVHAKNGDNKKAMGFAVLAYADVRSAKDLMGFKFIDDKGAIHAICR